MSLSANLKLLSLSKGFHVEEIKPEPPSYLIQNTESSSENPIECLVEKYGSKWKEEYYLTGCYNSGTDYLKIDISELNKLQNFIKSLID